jgi:hypothetical protein
MHSLKVIAYLGDEAALLLNTAAELKDHAR